MNGVLNMDYHCTVIYNYELWTALRASFQMEQEWAAHKYLINKKGKSYNIIQYT